MEDSKHRKIQKRIRIEVEGDSEFALATPKDLRDLEDRIIERLDKRFEKIGAQLTSISAKCDKCCPV
ncbi:MAG: hypothetical protein OXG24_13955 [Gammaproteobacteria bacterium]|nr:hypothetical protein [Gammaproteobacteria bacterium]